MEYQKFMVEKEWVSFPIQRLIDGVEDDDLKQTLMFLSTWSEGFCTLGFFMELLDTRQLYEFSIKTNMVAEEEPANMSDRILTSIGFGLYEGVSNTTEIPAIDLLNNLKIIIGVETMGRAAKKTTLLNRKNYSIVDTDLPVLGKLSASQLHSRIMSEGLNETLEFVKGLKE